MRLHLGLVHVIVGAAGFIAIATVSDLASAQVDFEVRKVSCTSATHPSFDETTAEIITQMCAISDSEEIEARVFTCRGAIVTAVFGPPAELIAVEAQMREICAIKHPAPPSVHWTCTGGAQFEAQIIEAAAAFVSAGKQRYLLRQVESPSGQRFERHGVELRIAADRAELTGADGGRYEACKGVM